MGSITDILSSIKFNVFEKNNISMKELMETMNNNFQGREGLRQRLVNRTPKYGNDDDYADDLAKRVFDAYFEAVDGRLNTKGGKYFSKNQTVSLKCIVSCTFICRTCNSLLVYRSRLVVCCVDTRMLHFVDKISARLTSTGLRCKKKDGTKSAKQTCLPPFSSISQIVNPFGEG